MRKISTWTGLGIVCLFTLIQARHQSTSALQPSLILKGTTFHQIDAEKGKKEADAQKVTIQQTKNVEKPKIEKPSNNVPVVQAEPEVREFPFGIDALSWDSDRSKLSITYSTPSSTSLSVTVQTITGEQVSKKAMTKTGGQFTSNLQISDLSAGRYLVELDNGKRILSRSFTVKAKEAI